MTSGEAASPGSSRLIAGAFLLVLGCGLRGGKPVPPPEAAAVPAPSTQGLRVTLLWSAPVDLDLYVTDPSLETVYFANTPAGSGGRLEHDVQCRDAEQARAVFTEWVVWPEPPPGRYRVGVDFIAACDKEVGEVGFRVAVDAGGRREEKVGTVTRARFEPIALEFDIDRETGAVSRAPGAITEAK